MILADVSDAPYHLPSHHDLLDLRHLNVESLLLQEFGIRLEQCLLNYTLCDQKIFSEKGRLVNSQIILRKGETISYDFEEALQCLPPAACSRRVSTKRTKRVTIPYISHAMRHRWPPGSPPPSSSYPHSCRN